MGMGLQQTQKRKCNIKVKGKKEQTKIRGECNSKNVIQCRENENPKLGCALMVTKCRKCITIISCDIEK